MGLLDGQVAIVTASAGSGIGQATARRFVEEGAEVVIADVHEKRAQETAQQMSRDYGREFLAVAADVSNVNDVQRMVQSALERHGKVDILVNNAARNIMSPVHEMTDDAWHTVLNVCLHGTFYCTRAVLPHMLERGSGRIVNLASVVGWEAAANQAAYAVAKAGIMAFTRAVAAEVARKGIRVNAVAPSFSPNPFLERIYPKGMLESFEKRSMLGRGAAPSEIANVILFLVSDLSSYMTGEVLSVSSQHA
jgi:3-oxoacyl-[acyl-carrier protein] reductase